MIRKVIALGLLVTSLGLYLTPPAEATSRDVKTVIKYSGYGAIAGTLVGLVTLPLTKNLGAMFAGTSVGLYLGIAVGVYQALYRYDSQNPMHFDPPQPQTSIEPVHGVGIPLAWNIPGSTDSMLKYYADPPDTARLAIPILKF